MSRGPRRLALGAAVLIALAGPGISASPFDRDGEVERAVEERIDGDPDLSRRPIDVTVDEGRALVEGRVRGLAEKRRAILEVGRVHGVLEVIDAIEVEVPRRSDESVRADLEALVRDRLKIGSSKLRFEVDEGAVLIEGSVEDARLRTRARNLAESVEGVGAVVVDVETPEYSDELVEAGLVALLAHRSVARVAGRIVPTVEGGVATLSGEVPRPYERMVAEDIAWGVNGVVAVVNELVIAPRQVEVPLVRP